MKNFLKKLPMQNKFFIFASLIFLLWLLTQIPYISLFLSPIALLFFTYFFAIFIFAISPKITLFVGLCILFVSIPWVLVGSRVHAEGFGVSSFFLLSFAFLQFAWQERKKS